MLSPILTKPIPPQVINEGAAYGPFDLKKFIQLSDQDGILHFQAGLKDGSALPKGMICTDDGLLTGIPAKNTQGNYEIIITAKNEAGEVQASLILSIKPSLLDSEKTYLNKLKTQVWEALEQNLPIPSELSELYDRAISAEEVQYILERWATLKIKDTSKQQSGAALKPLALEGASEHYAVYERGNCLVASPKDLFSHERTLADSLQTAVAMAREAYKRDWKVELHGYEKMVKAAWVEVQRLSDQHNKKLAITNFTPTAEDVEFYNKLYAKTKPDSPKKRMQ